MESPQSIVDGYKERTMRFSKIEVSTNFVTNTTVALGRVFLGGALILATFVRLCTMTLSPLLLSSTVFFR